MGCESFNDVVFITIRFVVGFYCLVELVLPGKYLYEDICIAMFVNGKVPPKIHFIDFSN